VGDGCSASARMMRARTTSWCGLRWLAARRSSSARLLVL